MMIQFDDEELRPAMRAMLAEAIIGCVRKDGHPERFGIYELARQIDAVTTASVVIGGGKAGQWPVHCMPKPVSTDDI